MTEINQVDSLASAIAKVYVDHEKELDEMLKNNLKLLKEEHTRRDIQQLEEEVAYYTDQAEKAKEKLAILKESLKRPASDHYDELITTINFQTPECILVYAFDLLNELLGNDEEVRMFIAQECCPQLSERIVRIISNNPSKMLLCLEEIYTICSEQGTFKTRDKNKSSSINGTKYSIIFKVIPEDDDIQHLTLHIYSETSSLIEPSNISKD
ncbi:unnamed protein product [Rotaria sordida]|uniref:Uncharacterized protein n=1 Tax=Rotaria sordida TaxID=392033 RepID=A0A815I3M9_9BILA|nr:unnamed protein product [Rotaria sordida]